MTFSGPGSREARRALLLDAQARVTAGTLPAAEAVHLSRAYKHLGSMQAATHAMAPEIAHRCASMAAAFQELKRGVFQARMHDVSTRCSLHTSLLCTRLLHNAGTWPQLTASEHARLHAAYVRPLRTILNMWLDREGVLIPGKHVISAAPAAPLEASWPSRGSGLSAACSGMPSIPDGAC